jgi:LmbE family N-acetylglucosaminyl deacetylase
MIGVTELDDWWCFMNLCYLLVVAHPDDETLGAGGIASSLKESGNSFYSAIMSGFVEARKNRPSDEELLSDTAKSVSLLGMEEFFLGDFPNIAFNTVSHLKLVQFVESIILKTNPDVIITHHPSDTNNDHLHTSLAVQAAIRLFQRRSNVKPISELMFMEVLSATDWSVNAAMNQFVPNVFIEIGEEGIDRKIEDLNKYRGVMREYPHPRSPESIKALAAYRGSQAGLLYAEAFQSVFRRIGKEKK